MIRQSIANSVVLRKSWELSLFEFCTFYRFLADLALLALVSTLNLRPQNGEPLSEFSLLWFLDRALVRYHESKKWCFLICYVIFATSGQRSVVINGLILGLCPTLDICTIHITSKQTPTFLIAAYAHIIFSCVSIANQNCKESIFREKKIEVQSQNFRTRGETKKDANIVWKFDEPRLGIGFNNPLPLSHSRVAALNIIRNPLSFHRALNTKSDRIRNIFASSGKGLY